MWELDHKEGWALKSWCLGNVVLEKIPKSPLDNKEIQPDNPEGNQFWIFIERTNVEAEAPILRPPDAKSQLIGKDPNAGENWGQEEKGATEFEMFGWYHQLNGHEFEQTQGDSEGQGSLACYSLWVCEEWTPRSDWTTTKAYAQEIRILINTRSMWNYNLLIFRSMLLFSFMETSLAWNYADPIYPIWVSEKTRHVQVLVGMLGVITIFPTSGLSNKMSLWVEHTCWTSCPIAKLYLFSSYSVTSSLLCPVVSMYMVTGKGILPLSLWLSTGETLTEWPIRVILISQALFGRGPSSGLNKTHPNEMAQEEDLGSTTLPYLRIR